MHARISPSGVLIAAGYGLGAVALQRGLPDQIPPSMTTPTGVTVWLGGWTLAFLLPTAAAVTNRLLRALCVRHPVDDGDAAQALEILDAILLRVIAFVTAMHGAVLSGVLGLLWDRAWIAQIVPVMLGLTLISVGNLLPLTRPNLAIGIRTRRTLSDRALWMRTHRVAGYLVVGLGLVIVVSAVALPSPAGPRIIHLVGPAVLLGAWLLTRRRARVHA